jgi:hypothetical protein
MALAAASAPGTGGSLPLTRAEAATYGPWVPLVCLSARAGLLYAVLRGAPSAAGTGPAMTARGQSAADLAARAETDTQAVTRGAAGGITSRTRPPAAGDCPRREGAAWRRSRPPPFPGAQPTR